MGTIIFIPSPEISSDLLVTFKCIVHLCVREIFELCRTMQSVAELPLLYRYQILLEGLLILCLKKSNYSLLQKLVTFAMRGQVPAAAALQDIPFLDGEQNLYYKPRSKK